MPARTEDSAADTRVGPPGRSSIPIGSLVLIAGVIVVFIYGILLKASGPAPVPAEISSTAPVSGIAAKPGARPASPSASLVSDMFGDTAAEPGDGGRERPLIPESVTASGTRSAGEPGRPFEGSGADLLASAPSSPASPTPGAAAVRATASNPSAHSSTVPAAPVSMASKGAAQQRSAASTLSPAPSSVGGSKITTMAGTKPSEGSSAPSAVRPLAGASPDDSGAAVEGASSAGSPDTAAVKSGATMRSGPSAPRGDAPAVSVRKARQSFAAHDYLSASRSWNDWAGNVPPGSWTVQIAAVRLDRATANRSLGAVAGRDDLFILPPGALANNLAPVCIGIYPSEEAARRAIAATAPFPGSSSRPIAKPLRSLRARS